MSGCQHLCHAFGGAFRFLIHSELVFINCLIFVHAILNVPAREVAAISSRESAGAKSANRSSLPVAIVNMSGVKRRLLCPRIGQRQTDGTLPCSFWNGVSGKRPGRGKKNDRQKHAPCNSLLHTSLRSPL